MPFSDSCTALGINLDLALSVLGKAFVKNTESRVKELSSDLNEVLHSGNLSAKNAQRLKGRMQFAEAQISGEQVDVV